MGKIEMILLCVDFALVFGSFLLLLYRGIYKAISAPSFFSWDRFMNLLWSFAATLAIGHALFIRTTDLVLMLVTTCVIVAQWWILIFRLPLVPLDFVLSEINSGKHSK